MAKRDDEEIPQSMFRLVKLNSKLFVIEATSKITLVKQQQRKVCWKIPRDTVFSEVFSLHRSLDITHHHCKGKRLYSARVLVIGQDQTLVLRAGQSFLLCYYAPPDSSSESEDTSDGQDPPDIDKQPAMLAKNTTSDN